MAAVPIVMAEMGAAEGVTIGSMGASVFKEIGHDFKNSVRNELSKAWGKWIHEGKQYGTKVLQGALEGAKNAIHHSDTRPQHETDGIGPEKDNHHLSTDPQGSGWSNVVFSTTGVLDLNTGTKRTGSSFKIDVVEGDLEPVLEKIRMGVLGVIFVVGGYFVIRG